MYLKSLEYSILHNYKIMSCFIFFINLNLLKPLLIIDFFSVIIVYIFIKFSNLYIITVLETNLNLFKLPKCFYNVYILFSMFVKKTINKIVLKLHVQDNVHYFRKMSPTKVLIIIQKNR